MAENVVEYALRLKYEGAPALKAAEKDARDVQKANDDAARSAKEAAREQIENARNLATATARLEDLAATGNKVQGAALHLRRLREEVAGLVQSTGNASLGKQILGDAERDFATLVTSSNQGAKALGGVADQAGEAGKQIGIGRNQMISLKAALGDTVGSLVAGQNPFTVILQQGPQAASALFTLDGGIRAVGVSLRATLAPVMATAIPAMAALAVATATVGTAYIVTANYLETAAVEQTRLSQAHVTGAMDAGKAAAATETLTKAWEAFSSAAAGVKLDLDIINGKVSAQAAAGAARAKELTDAALPGLKAAAQRVAELRVAVTAADDLTRDRSLSSDEQVAAMESLKGLRAEYKASKTELDKLKGALDESKASVGDLTEYNEALAASEEFVRNRTEAAAAAKRKAAEDERAAKEAAAAEADYLVRVAAAQKRLLTQAAKDFEAFYGPVRDEGAEALREFYDTLAGIVPPKALSSLEQLGLAEADITLAYSRGKLTVEEYTAAVEALNAARAQKMDGGSADTGIATTGAAIAGGPQAGINAIASAGPIGAFIAAIANMVVGLEDTLSGFSEFHMQFSETIGNLPEIIFGHLEETLTDSTKAAIEMIPAFIMSLAKSLPGLFESIVAGLPEVFGTLIQSFLIDLPDAIFELVGALARSLPQLVVGLIGAIIDAIPQLVGAWIDQMVSGVVRIVDAFVKVFTQVFSDILGTGEGEGKTFNQGGIFDQIFTGKKEAANGTEGPGLFQKGGWFDTAGKDIAKWAGSFDTGTDGIARTGLALVHQGERIVPSSGAMSGVTAAMMGGGGGSSVHVYMPPGLIIGTAEETAREVARSAGRGVGGPL